MSEQPEGHVVAVATFYAKGSEFGYDIDTELSEEIMGGLLRTAADVLEGKDDRAAGAWGR